MHVERCDKNSLTYKTLCKTLLLGPVLLFLSLAPEIGAFAQNYQAAEPKMDTPPPIERAPAATLQGGVQHVDKRNGKKGRLMTGAKKGQSDALKARVRDDSNPLRAQAQSSIGIIGVKFVAQMGKPPVINEIFPNTPAERVGLRISDMIVAVDGVPTSGLSKDEVFDLIVGTPGTSVSLSILRNGDYSAVSCVRMDINELLDPRIRRDYLIHL